MIDLKEKAEINGDIRRAVTFIEKLTPSEKYKLNSTFIKRWSYIFNIHRLKQSIKTKTLKLVKYSEKTQRAIQTEIDSLQTELQTANDYLQSKIEDYADRQ